MRRLYPVAAGMLILWIALIFGTSCTVVRPQEFFDWIHEHVYRDEATFQTFQTFWGLSWFAIVKGWHAAEFAILMLLAVAATARLTGRRSRRTVVVSMLLCIAFAISDEWHQTFVPDRSGTVTDVLIDSLGVLFVSFVLLRKPCSLASSDTHDSG